MGIGIKLQTCFALPDSGLEITDLPEEVEKVRDLLRYVGKQIGFEFIDASTGELEEDLEIIINNKEVWFYPTKLDTVLKDGDTVEIYLLPLGGG